MPENFNFAPINNGSGVGPGRPTSQDNGLSNRSPTSADAGVGVRIRSHRRAGGWTLKEIAGAVGVTGAQLHRYETGTTRVATSRLMSIASALGVAPETLMQVRPSAPQPPLRLIGDDTTGGLVELVETYATITDPRRRSALIAFARAVSRGEGPAEAS
jgi:transcriptional regulator with XRE-family HTH domain